MARTNRDASDFSERSGCDRIHRLHQPRRLEISGDDQRRPTDGAAKGQIDIGVFGLADARAGLVARIPLGRKGGPNAVTAGSRLLHPGLKLGATGGGKGLAVHQCGRGGGNRRGRRGIEFGAWGRHVQFGLIPVEATDMVADRPPEAGQLPGSSEPAQEDIGRRIVAGHHDRARQILHGKTGVDPGLGDRTDAQHVSLGPMQHFREIDLFPIGLGEQHRRERHFERTAMREALVCPPAEPHTTDRIENIGAQPALCAPFQRSQVGDPCRHIDR
jgi:hypothetical protein